MQISYGPPGQRGVTQLVAIGAAELEESPTDQAVNRGFWVGLAAWAFGGLIGSNTIRNMGAGAAIGFGAVKYFGAPGKVQITQP